MATDTTFKNVAPGEMRIVPIGFLWTSLFFGIFVPLIQNDGRRFWGWLFLYVGLGLITLGFMIPILCIVQAFTYNKTFIRRLSEQGFKPADESSTNLAKAHGVYFER